MATFPPCHERMKVYFTERFPILVYAPFVIILFFCLSFLVQLISGNDLILDASSIVGCVTAFFMMLLIRTFDDIKDVDLDHDIFPNRPVSRGAVSIKDVYFLSAFSFSVLVLVNIFFSWPTIKVFAIVMLYALGTFKFFFAKRIHIEKPVVAMITHQPLPLSIIFLLIHLSLATGSQYDNFLPTHFFLLLTFALPITAWEISRKTKAPSQEIDRYETFSRILGPKVSASLPLILYTISAGSSLVVANQLELHLAYFVLIPIYFLITFIVYFRFILKPIEKNNVLVTTSLLFTSALFLTLLIFVFVKNDLSQLF